MDIFALGMIALASLLAAYIISSILWKGIEILFKTAITLALTIIIAGVLFMLLK